MTVGKTSALSLGLVGAFALGIWVSPQVRETPVADVAPVVMVSEPTPEVAEPRTRTVRAIDMEPETEARVLMIAASAERVQRQAKDVLSSGTNVKTASAGFKNAEQFLSVAYAARNTEVPFALLKHRVVTEGKSLADAIRESKPSLDATLESNRARLEARSELSRLE
jgi:predicted dinucleotide-utilizing enzyme